MKKERLFMNTENEEVLTMEELKAFYEENKNEFDYSFDGYLNNCLSKNGSLEEIQELRFLNMEELRIITIDELYSDYDIEKEFDELPNNVKSFNDYIQYRERKNYDEMFMIKNDVNYYGLSVYESLDYLMNKYNWDGVGAWHILIELIDDGMFEDATLEDIDRLSEDYIDR